MKRYIALFILVISFTKLTKATNHDTIPCLDLSARIESTPLNNLQGYSIEFWSEYELISMMNATNTDIFHFELKRNVQYAILIFKGDTVVKKVLINTKTPLSDIKKGQKMELTLGFPDPMDCDNKRCILGTIDFDYDMKEFLYKEGESDEGLLKNF